MAWKRIALGAIVVAAVFAGGFWLTERGSWMLADYKPKIDPNDFSTQIVHPYFTLTPGARFNYVSSNRRERIETQVTREVRSVMGVDVVVVLVREWINDSLREETKDWYARHKDGSVWYFGEEVNNYTSGGDLRDHAGSWEAGIDGAMPGVIMLATPKVGDTYRQEFYARHAEDMGTVANIGHSAVVPAGSFSDCVRIRDWSLIELGSEYKTFCREVGYLVLEEEGSDRIELTEIMRE